MLSVVPTELCRCHSPPVIGPPPCIEILCPGMHWQGNIKPGLSQQTATIGLEHVMVAEVLVADMEPHALAVTEVES